MSNEKNIRYFVGNIEIMNISNRSRIIPLKYEMERRGLISEVYWLNRIGDDWKALSKLDESIFIDQSK